MIKVSNFSTKNYISLFAAKSSLGDTMSSFQQRAKKFVALQSDETLLLMFSMENNKFDILFEYQWL